MDSARQRDGSPVELVATLGPASFRHAPAMAEAGATAFRLNGSHLASDELRSAIAARSESCHLFDLLERGYAGIVLSDETAIGVDPVRAVRRAASLLQSFGGS